MQGQTYTIDANGAISPAISSTPAASIVIIADKAFKNKTFQVLGFDSSTVFNPNKDKLDVDFSKNMDDHNYHITIQADRKIQGCATCLSVTDDFFVTLDGKRYGAFHLSPSGTGSTPVPPVPAGTPAYILGSAVNDALFMAADIKEQKEGKTIKQILDKQYGITNLSELNTNEFLKTDLHYVFVGAGVHGLLSLQSLFGTVGGLDVTNVADGLTKFIVKRTKEELSIAFFRNFKKEIASNPDLNTVFPNTATLLYNIDEEIYDYNKYINNLRDAFHLDLQVIDENIPQIIDNHEAFFNKPENVRFAVGLRSGSYIATALKNKMHPGNIIANYPIEFFNDPKGASNNQLADIKGAVQSLRLFNESLKEVDTSLHTYWISFDQVTKLVNNKDALKIYIGLVLQLAKNKYDNVTFSNGKDFYTLLNTAANAANFSTDYTSYRRYVTNIANKAGELNQLMKDDEKADTDSLKVEKYAKYFKATVQLIQAGTQVSDLRVLKNVPQLVTLEETTKKYSSIAIEVVGITTAINQKRYAEAVNHLVATYSLVYADPAASAAVASNDIKLTRQQKIKLADNLISQNATDGSVTVSTVVTQDGSVAAEVNNKDAAASKASHVRSKLLFYGSFMVNMITAKNSDDVAEAIESAALPTGSSSIKRTVPFNVSVNAYCGLFAGNEIIKDVDDNKPFGKFNSFGLSVPIGIAFSKGDRLLPWPFCFIPVGKGFSSTLFLSVVDLGAVAAFRFKDETTEQVPTIQLKDIISPGLFWSLGIPKTPISVNLGVQTGPNLRKVTPDGNDYSNKLYTRYSVGACVDIPLFNLYSKPKN